MRHRKVMQETFNQISQIIPDLLLAIFVLIAAINQGNAQRLRKEEIRLKEREELLEKIDSLEKKVVEKTEAQQRLLDELAHCRPLAAKVPILELQIENLKLERQSLVDRIMALERRLDSYTPSEYTET